MNPWIAFMIGIFVGANVGFLAAALCRVSAKSDQQIREMVAKEKLR